MALIGRTSECARIDALLEGAAAGQADALLIHGEPGIGKTALLEYARSAAGERRMRVISCGGVEAESLLPFSGLLELLRPLLPALAELPETQASVLSGALALGPPVPADPFAVSAATLTLVATAAEQEPLLVIVDDAHWLDPASLDALLFVNRRLEADCVCLLLASRDPVPAAIERAELATLHAVGLELEPACALLDSVSLTPVAADVGERLASRTAGNPLALIELARLLTEEELAGHSSLSEPLRTGPVIERAFAEQLSELTPEARRALAVASASMSERVEPILAALAELALEASLLESAEELGLVTIADGRLTFRHPLLRSAAYHQASPAVLRSAHRALATHEDNERAAWHLAYATVSPDEHVAMLLEAEAVRARDRSGYAAAGEAYERAAQLTPAAKRRTERLIQAAHCLEAVGLAERATKLLERAVEESAGDTRLQVEIAQTRAAAELRRGHYGEAGDLLLRATTFDDLDPSRASMLLSGAAVALIPTERAPEALEAAARAADLAPEGSQPHVFAELLLDYIQFLQGERGKFNGLGLGMAMDGAEFSPELAEQIAVGCHILLWHEQYDRARMIVDRALDTARAHAAIGAMPNLLAAQAQLAFRIGDWPLAYAAATEAVRLTRDTTAQANPFPLAYLAHIEAALGLEAASRDNGRRAIEIAQRQGNLAGLDYAHAALGLLELSLGNTEQAIDELEEVGRLQSRYGLRDPSVSPWRPDLIEAYVRAGRTEDAKQLLSSLEAEAQRTKRSWPLAATQRCRGMLAGDGFDTEFEQALRLHQETTTPFELARTELAYGERLRRNRRRVDARVRLGSALEAFELLGAEAWTNRARQELAATGETAHRGRAAVAGLTAQEIQVASLIEAGASNKEAAARLFISRRTIDAHLSHIYRKLGIHSRDELGEALGHSPPIAPEPQ